MINWHHNSQIKRSFQNLIHEVISKHFTYDNFIGLPKGQNNLTCKIMSWNYSNICLPFLAIEIQENCISVKVWKTCIYLSIIFVNATYLIQILIHSPFIKDIARQHPQDQFHYWEIYGLFFAIYQKQMNEIFLTFLYKWKL